MVRYFFVAVLMLQITTVTAQSYMSRDSLIENPRIYFNAGGYFPKVTTEVRVDGDRLGTDLSLEDDFKFLRDVNVFKAEATVRLKEKSQLLFGFTSIQRASNFKLDRELKFADTSFAVNASADMYFDTYYYALTWRYSFWNKTNWNAGASIGLRMVQFKTGIEARLEGNEPYKADASVLAPALLLGIHGGAYLEPRLLVRYSFEFLRLKVAGINVGIIETQASIGYFVTKNIGVGVAFSTNSYNVSEIPLSDFKGRIKFDFGGGNLFLTARF